MQYYTKQQLQGAGRFSPNVRIGNWSEELNLEETKLKDFLLRQQQGSLKLNRCVLDSR
jgi:hypothetical protein